MENLPGILVIGPTSLTYVLVQCCIHRINRQVQNSNIKSKKKCHKLRYGTGLASRDVTTFESGSSEAIKSSN